MKLSRFGNKLTRPCGINELMTDLGDALSINRDILMLGGGNPAHIPAVQKHFRARLQKMLAQGDALERELGNYDTPRGHRAFIDALVKLLNNTFGWGLTSDHIALTNGSQTAFFILLNMFGGTCEDDSFRRILLPLTPEYIGYADQGIEEGLFVAARPEFEFIDRHTFKYHVDFRSLPLGDDCAAICVSRPTNPTGNVLTNDEIEKLSGLARAREIPLIIDNAYGTPFPHIIFTDVEPVWGEHVVLCMSLSKLGLPGTRTGIVIARPEIASAVAQANAILSLAPGSVGSALALDLVESGEIISMSNDIIRPYYERKARAAVEQLTRAVDGLDCYIHRAEGALFLWLWLKDLPITSREFYERLKQRGVLVVSGDYFFPGLKDDWRHRHECIRITYSQDDAMVRKGLAVIAEEARAAYA